MEFGLNADETRQMSATISPGNATNQQITWSIEHGDDCETIPPATNYVTIAASDLITAIGDNGCSLKVVAEAASNPISRSVNFNVATLVTGVTIGDGDGLPINCATSSFQLNSLIVPENATDNSVTWNASGTSVSVNETTGVIILVPVGVGTTSQITATANDDGSGQSDVLDVFCLRPVLFWLRV